MLHSRVASSHPAPARSDGWAPQRIPMAKRLCRFSLGGYILVVSGCVIAPDYVSDEFIPGDRQLSHFEARSADAS